MLLHYDAVSHPGVNLPTRAPIVLGVIWTVHALTLLFFGVRVLVKTKLRKLGGDDALIAASVILSLVMVITTTYECKLGLGQHTANFRPEYQLLYGRLAYTGVAVGGPAMLFAKVSMPIFFLRFAGRGKTRLLCQLAIAYIIVTSVPRWLINTFPCSPVSAAWDRSIPSKCIDSEIFIYWGCINNAVIDVGLVLIPIPILMNLKVPIRVKLGLMAMFSMGFVIIAVSLVSIYLLGPVFRSDDILWDAAYLWMWTVVEVHITIMTACMPGVKLFYKWVRGDKGNQTSQSGRTKSGNDTIGGGGGNRKKKNTFNLTLDGTMATVHENSDGALHYKMEELGGSTRSTEVLVEMPLHVRCKV